jgi:hypothetical protein
MQSFAVEVDSDELELVEPRQRQLPETGVVRI